MSAYSPSINQDARTHAEHECEIRYLKRLVERKLKEVIFSDEKPAPAPQVAAPNIGTTNQVAVGS